MYVLSNATLCMFDGRVRGVPTFWFFSIFVLCLILDSWLSNDWLSQWRNGFFIVLVSARKLFVRPLFDRRLAASFGSGGTGIADCTPSLVVTRLCFIIIYASSSLNTVNRKALLLVLLHYCYVSYWARLVLVLQVIVMEYAWKSGKDRDSLLFLRPNPFYMGIVRMLLEEQKVCVCLYVWFVI